MLDDIITTLYWMDLNFKIDYISVYLCMKSLLYFQYMDNREKIKLKVLKLTSCIAM